MDRQIRLNRNGTTLDLTSSLYRLEAGTWSSSNEQLAFSLIIEATTLTQVDRYVNDVQRWLAQAVAWDQMMAGDAVYVETKVCDELSTQAEIGAGWMRKRIVSGGVEHEDVSVRASGNYMVSMNVSLMVSATWERATVAPVLVASSACTVRTDGGVTVPAAATLTARRMTWTATTGLTVRVRWLYTNRDCYFLLAETGANDVKALYLATDQKLYIYDDVGGTAISSALTATTGDELDIVFKWHPGTKMGIWVNGIANGAEGSCTLDVADIYQVFAPSTLAQTLLSWQCWPAALTDAECAALNAWGCPEPELAYLLAPADADNTDAFYKLHNVPGTDTALMRMVLSNYSSGTDYDQIAYGLRPLRIQTTHLWECEAGSLGANTANNVNADASAGNQARYTPPNANYSTEITVVLCADPNDVAAMQGRHRLYLACYDSAASLGLNVFQWRLVVAGVAEDWSDTLQATAVSSRLLLDLGEVSIPPGAWPEESIDAVTDVHAGSFITLELQVKNTAGLGGGTFDFDAVYLAPAELEGVVTCSDLDNTDEYMVIDWASDPPAAVSVRDYRSFEFATWGKIEGHTLMLTPVHGDAGTLWLYAYRNTTDSAYPNDDLNAWLYYRPRWQ